MKLLDTAMGTQEVPFVSLPAEPLCTVSRAVGPEEGGGAGGGWGSTSVMTSGSQGQQSQRTGSPLSLPPGARKRRRSPALPLQEKGNLEVGG